MKQIKSYLDLPDELQGIYAYLSNLGNSGSDKSIENLLVHAFNESIKDNDARIAAKLKKDPIAKKTYKISSKLSPQAIADLISMFRNERLPNLKLLVKKIMSEKTTKGRAPGIYNFIFTEWPMHSALDVADELIGTINGTAGDDSVVTSTPTPATPEKPEKKKRAKKKTGASIGKTAALAVGSHLAQHTTLLGGIAKGIGAGYAFMQSRKSDDDDEEEDKPKKPGFFSRLFGSKKSGNITPKKSTLTPGRATPAEDALEEGKGGDNVTTLLAKIEENTRPKAKKKEGEGLLSKIMPFLMMLLRPGVLGGAAIGAGAVGAGKWAYDKLTGGDTVEPSKSAPPRETLTNPQSGEVAISGKKGARVVGGPEAPSEVPKVTPKAPPPPGGGVITPPEATSGLSKGAAELAGKSPLIPSIQEPTRINPLPPTFAIPKVPLITPPPTIVTGDPYEGLPPQEGLPKEEPKPAPKAKPRVRVRADGKPVPEATKPVPKGPATSIEPHPSRTPTSIQPNPARAAAKEGSKLGEAIEGAGKGPKIKEGTGVMDKIMKIVKGPKFAAKFGPKIVQKIVTPFTAGLLTGPGAIVGTLISAGLAAWTAYDIYDFISDELKGGGQPITDPSKLPEGMKETHQIPGQPQPGPGGKSPTAVPSGAVLSTPSVVPSAKSAAPLPKVEPLSTAPQSTAPIINNDNRVFNQTGSTGKTDIRPRNDDDSFTRYLDNRATFGYN